MQSVHQCNMCTSAHIVLCRATRTLGCRCHGIGGALDDSRLTQLNRPSDPQAIAREVRRLHHTGLEPRDIAISLRPAIVPAIFLATDLVSGGLDEEMCIRGGSRSLG